MVKLLAQKNILSSFLDLNMTKVFTAYVARAVTDLRLRVAAFVQWTTLFKVGACC
jgi:hypothetical protein